MQSLRLGGARILWSGAGARSVLVMTRQGVVGSVAETDTRFRAFFGRPWPANFHGQPLAGGGRLALFAGPAAASPDGERVVALSVWVPALRRVDGPARFGSWQEWSVARRKPLWVLSADRFPSGNAEIPPRGPRRFIFTDGGWKLVGFSRNGLFFFAARGLRFIPSPSAAWQASHIIRLVQNRGAGNLFVAICLFPGRIEVWDGATEKRVVIIPPPALTSWGGPKLRAALCGWRCAVAWGRHLAVYDARTGLRLFTTKLAGKCEGLALSTRGNRLAVCVSRGWREINTKAVRAVAKRVRLYLLRVSPRLPVLASSAWRPTTVSGSVELAWLGRRGLAEATGRALIFWRLRGGSVNSTTDEASEKRWPINRWRHWWWAKTPSTSSRRRGGWDSRLMPRLAANMRRGNFRASLRRVMISMNDSILRPGHGRNCWPAASATPTSAFPCVPCGSPAQFLHALAAKRHINVPANHLNDPRR